MAHLTAHRIERQLGKGDERRQLVSGGNHQIGGLPAASVTTLDLPAIHLFGNGNRRGVEHHLQQPAGLCFFDSSAGEICRAEPAAQRVADAAVAAGQADDLFYLRGQERLHQLGREGALTHFRELGCRVVVITELGYPAQGKGDGMALGQCQQAVAGIAKGKRIETRQRIVLAVKQWIEGSLAVA